MSDEKPMQADTPVEETEETVDQSTDQTAEATSEESKDAYYEKQIEELKSELSKESEAKDNLLKAVNKQRAEAKESKEPEVTAQEATMSDARIAELVSKATDDKYNEMRVDMATSLFDEELEKISINEKEKQLIKLRYQKSVKPSGFDRTAIRNDLLLAKAAANIDRVKLSTETGDVSLTTAMSGGGGKVSSAESTARVELSADEQKLLRKFGVSPEKAAKDLAK